MTVTDELVLRRSPLEGIAEAYSGATLERVELVDGRCYVLKHLPAEGDWLTRASGGRDRLRRLWEDGVLDRVSAVVDHAIVDVIDDHGHDVVVMRDVSHELLAPDGPVSRATSRQLLAGLAGLHDVGRAERSHELCGVGARYQMFAPQIHASADQPGTHPARELILAGWDLFAEHAAREVVDAVFAVHDDPSLLDARLAAYPKTLLHGDAKLPNLGFGPAGLIAIDWGDLTGFGPPEVDVAWYALMNESRIGTSPDETFADYAAAASRPLETEAVDLACVGSLAQMGFKFAGAAFRGKSPEIRDRAGACLSWWCRRVTAALDRTGLV